MSNNLMRKIGIKIKFERVKKGLSQEKLAELANISMNFVSMIERANANPTIETLESLAKALDIPIEELVNPKNIEL